MAKKVSAQYNFNIEPHPDGHKVTYSKNKFGLGLGCGIFIMVLLLSPLLSLLVSPITDNLVFNWIVLPIGLTILIHQLINRSRKDKFFIIGHDFIGVEDRHYALKDIRKIYIKDPKGTQYQTTQNGGTGFVMAGSGMGAVAVGAASVASSGARATSELINKSIHKASFKIEFLYGNKKVALAKGLSENNAFVLFDAVLELLAPSS